MAAAIRILLVDDEPSLLDIGKLVLEQSEDFNVTTALSAPEALRLLEQEQFDAIIADYQMPGMDGIQFLFEVRTRFSPTPFILFTGRGREDVVIQAINSGADFYLEKSGEPDLQFAELAHKIKSMALRKRADDALRMSEEKYRHIIEYSNEAIVVAQDGMLKSVNHRAVEFTGYSKQELLSMSFSTIIHPDDRAMVVERYQKRMKGEDAPSRYPFRISKKDGSTRWGELSVAAIDWGGRPATLNFITDITERKKAEDALREREERYKNISKATTDFVFSCIKPEGGTYSIDWIAGAVERITGYTIDELLAMGCWRCLVHPDDTSVFDENITHLAAGTSSACILRIRTKSGTIRWLAVNTTQVPAKDSSSVSHVFGGCRDITDHKQAGDALAESEEHFRMLLQHIPLVSIQGYSIDGTTHYWDEASEHLYGYTASEAIGKNLIDLIIPPEMQEDVRKACKYMADSGQPIPASELTLMRKDGSRVAVFSSHALFKKTGGEMDLYCIDIDLTDRKRAEAALRQANRQLKLLSSITRHDILNQLMALKGYLYLSHKVIDNPTTLIEYIKKEELAVNTIEHQIAFTRDYQDLGVTVPAWQNVNASIEKAVAGLPMRDVRVEPDPADPEVYADLLFLKVFYNLIDNALRYGGDQMKTIRVFSQETDTGLTILCEDDGVGIIAEDKNRLFTKGFGENTGLGLFLSREILAITGITIRETGEPGKGARFEMTVPKGMYRFTGTGGK
ncbi:MAG: PAS domain S-box protein [Methanoregula sp.]|nr:PAS domain S-box protein [Methanoregula sp.]